MTLDALRDGLTSAGLDARVEERGRVAIVIPNGEMTLNGEARRRVVALARQHGFSNVCVELAPRDANLPGD